MLGMMRYDATETMSAIAVPTLVVPGDIDPVCKPEASERMRGRRFWALSCRRCRAQSIWGSSSITRPTHVTSKSLPDAPRQQMDRAKRAEARFRQLTALDRFDVRCALLLHRKKLVSRAQRE